MRGTEHLPKRHITHWEAFVARRSCSIHMLLLAGTMLAGAISTRAAEVTPERLLNPDKEPQNWLMNHRTYDGQRFSPLDKINKGNVKDDRWSADPGLQSARATRCLVGGVQAPL
jgi:glucose dehydrogenase